MRSRGPLLVAASVTVLLLALAGRYGPHRDELYFVVAGQHPSTGYPDQPPLTPLVAALTQAVAPQSVWALHVPSALATGLLCLVGAATAGELGGSAWARTTAALGCACGAVVLVVGHELSTTTLDVLTWATLTWLVLRALRLRWRSGWLLVGLDAGVGLEDKWLVLLLLLGLGVGLVAVRAARERLPWRWLAAAAAVAVVLWLPNLLWQRAHGWPQLHLTGQIHDEYGGVGGVLQQVALVLTGVSPLALLVWVPGLVRLLRRGADPAWARSVAVAFLVIAAVVLATGGKAYYLAGLYPALLAAGAVGWERRERRWPAPVLLVVGVLPVLPSLLPVLPERVYRQSPWAAVVEDGRETIGWPGLVRAVAAARDTVPAAQRGSVVVLTANYGEAGAVDFYGPRYGLPHAFSGHNGFGLWGPPTSAGPVVAVAAPGEGGFGGVLGDCRQVAVVHTHTDDEEDGAVVSVCAAPPQGWAAAWPRVVFLSA